MVNYHVKVFACLLCVSFLCAISAAQATTPEPPGPKASIAVRKILDDANHLAAAQQGSESLNSADEALKLARQTNDPPGEAFAQAARGKALQILGRFDEAVLAWQNTAEIWSRLHNTPEQITALIFAGLASSKKEDAEKLYAYGLSIAKLEASHPAAVAQALQDAGLALHKNDQKLQALNYLQAALPLREKLSPESLEMVELLNALANTTRLLGVDGNDEKYYSLAKDYATRAVEIGQRVGPNSPALVQSLHYLCWLERSIDTLPHAREHCLQALRIDKELAPSGSLTQSKILGTLGGLELDETHFVEARKYYEEGLALAAKFDIPESEHYQTFFLGLSAVDTSEGDLQAARDHLEQLVTLQEKYHGWMAPTYVNLGQLALEQYDFESARDYSQKAVDLFLKTKPKNVGLAYALGNLGLAAFRQGDVKSALEYGRRLMEIDSHRPDGLDTADDYDQMGDLYLSQHDLVSAEGYYHRAMDIRAGLVPESLGVSFSLANLASVARARGNRTDALTYEKRALAMGKKSCPNSWCVAQVLDDLGRLEYEQGDLAESESYFREAVDVREKSLGIAHPELARSLSGLALTKATLGKSSEALETALRAERIGSDHLRISVRSLSERQALAYEAVRASGLDLALSMVSDSMGTASARGQIFDAVIHSRALVLDELAARHRSAYGSGDPEVSRIADQLASSRAQLATLVYRGVGDTSPETYRKLLDDVRARKENAERALAEKSLAFRQDQARERIGLADVASFIPEHSALVSYVRYARYALRNWPSKVPPAAVPSYGAFILQAGHSEPEFVPLGRADEIERLIASWRLDISRQTETIAVSAGRGDASRRSGLALRHTIWDPVASKLTGAAQVLIVPDAALHLVNCAALPSSNSQYLIETGPLIHYISTERDLVPTQSSRGEGILIVGNPAFDQANGRMQASNPPMARSGALATGFLRSGCGTFKSLHFTPLPASQHEVDRISALWKVSTAAHFMQMTGADASPEAFKRFAPGKRVLHVATHGFFLQGECDSAAQVAFDSKRDDKLLPATAENPLLLSGLAFAGANRRSTAGRDESDGILTAEEIAGMDLGGVDWAVLSACDTGIGEIKVGEGVFGLRRAFQVAGAKTVIMSLWPIEDETAQHWMDTLYREHFVNGKTTAEAVRSASLQLLNQRRAKHQSTHPFYWGAFIAAGDWH